MSAHRSGDTQPELETLAFRRAAGLHAAASPFGLQLVFPELRTDPLSAGEVVPLVLGRDGDGDGRLSGSEISRRHAELRAADGQLVLRDLESRNGLYVNGKRYAETTLSPHDVVRMGEWVAVVVALDAGPRMEPQPGLLDASLHLGPVARQVALRASRMAPARVSVVLEGESGTGKERFARAIHDWSGRKGPFVAIHCAALSESLAEAQLFGHRAGALPGATRDSAGYFRAAEAGTLFLEEIRHLPATVQGKLRRALEEGEVVPVGESRPVPVDVRVIAASQVPLARAVAEKRLCPELQGRLEGFTLQLPPLRERRQDIPSLFLHLLARHGLTAPELSPRMVEALCIYDWPLNVRELDHLAQHLSLLHAHDPSFRRSHLPDRIRYGTADAEDAGPWPTDDAG